MASVVNERVALRPVIYKSNGPAINLSRNTMTMERLFGSGAQGFWYDPNDLSTLYQDAAGTIPVTAAGQAVGLMLDKSKWLVLGNDIIVNGGFNTDTSWAKNTGVTISGGAANINTTATAHAIAQSPTVPVGKLYKVTYTVSSYVSGSIRCIVGGVAGALRNAVGTFTEYVASAGSSTLQLATAGGFIGSVDNFSVKEIMGNHAKQTTSSMRPLLKQRPSELVINGDFSDGVNGWTQSGTATVTVSGGILTVQSNGSTSGVYQDFMVKPNTKYRLSSTVSESGRQAVYGAWAFNPLIGLANAGVLEFTPTSDKIRIYLYCGSTGVGTFDNISLRKVVEDSYISNVISFDAIDDNITTPLPAQLTGCTVVRSIPNVGTQILTNQTIPTPYNDATNHCGLIVINRALTAVETSQITQAFNKAAGV